MVFGKISEKLHGIEDMRKETQTRIDRANMKIKAIEKDKKLSRQEKDQQIIEFSGFRNNEQDRLNLMLIAKDKKHFKELERAEKARELQREAEQRQRK